MPESRNPTSTATRGLHLALSALAGLLACAALVAGMAALARPALAAPSAQSHIWPSTEFPCGTSLQACMNGIALGDTVIVQSGTHTVSVTLNRAISLTGVSSATAILHAMPLTRALTVLGSAVDSSVVISGLTFTGGDLEQALGYPAYCGGGLLVANNARPRLVNITAIHNVAHAGGGICTEGSVLNLTNGFVISNATSSYGGGLYASSAAVLSGGLVQGNQCTSDTCIGGGMYAGTLALTGTRFVNNTARWLGGAAYVGFAATLNGGEFRDNQCIFNSCSGGAISMGGSLTLSGTHFIDNRAGERGGGLYLVAPATLSGGLFQGNHCVELQCSGGGLYAGAPLTLTHMHFISNTARAIGGGGVHAISPTVVSGGLFQGNQCTDIICFGGGLYAANTLVLTSAQFVSNSARYVAGGAYAGQGAWVSGGLFQGNQCVIDGCVGGGLHAQNALVLTGALFISNTAHFSGGGLRVAGPAAVSGGLFQGNQCTQAACLGGGISAANALTLTSARLSGNTAAGNGGGLHHAAGDGAVINNLFTDNAAGDGAAMYLASTGAVSVLHNTLAGTGPGPAAGAHVAAGAVSLVNNILAGQVIGIERSGGTATQDYNLFDGTVVQTDGTVGGGLNSSAGAAGFANAAAGDYRLTQASDAVDAGTNAGIPVDFFGNPRPQGAGFDIGFHEYDPVRRVFLPLVVRNP